MKELFNEMWYLFLIILMVYILVQVIIIQPIENYIKTKKRNTLIDGMVKELKESVNSKPKKDTKKTTKKEDK